MTNSASPGGTPSGALADLDLTPCPGCGTVAEVSGGFEMPGLDGTERYVRTRCMVGHVFVGPEFALRTGFA
ncbi:hypothetical protein [Euzebya tangerina]|uniref:hypothetical protein n=1 Tax=Euzebya tangerina TaxID=591198 RepID=UPI000E31D209|nr:hypothetical protein [Euzebya tangerina]